MAQIHGLGNTSSHYSAELRAAKGGGGSEAPSRGETQNKHRICLTYLDLLPTYRDKIWPREVPDDPSRRADAHVTDDREEPPAEATSEVSGPDICPPIVPRSCVPLPGARRSSHAMNCTARDRPGGESRRGTSKEKAGLSWKGKTPRAVLPDGLI